jgi:hypothetical protein
MIPSSDLTPGAWRASWGAWQIDLTAIGHRWHAFVRNTTLMTNSQAMHDSAGEAVRWACAVLYADSARVMVDGHEQSVEPFLAFEPRVDP